MSPKSKDPTAANESNEANIRIKNALMSQSIDLIILKNGPRVAVNLVNKKVLIHREAIPIVVRIKTSVSYLDISLKKAS